jgi:hypothetical protein
MPQDLLQGKHIAAVDQVVGSKGMAAEMGMETFYTGLPGQPLDHELHRITAHGSSLQRQEDTVIVKGERLLEVTTQAF